MEKNEYCKIAAEYICNGDICKLQQSTFATETFAKLNEKNTFIINGK
jgi:DeoR/GlpR family transcriptional regulator of sugar metabolism